MRNRLAKAIFNEEAEGEVSELTRSGPVGGMEVEAAMSSIGIRLLSDSGGEDVPEVEFWYDGNWHLVDDPKWQGQLVDALAYIRERTEQLMGEAQETS